MTRHAALAILLSLLACGCTVNPVTGKSELMLVSTADEVAIGREQYPLAIQMQGGRYRVDAELSAYVSEVGQRLAAVSDRELPYEFVVINDSVPNAWALPGGKIAVNRGLLAELDNEAELAALLSHEIVHAAARHGAAAMTRSMLAQSALAVTAVSLRNSDYGEIAAGGSQLAAFLVMQRYGRTAEREADRYGMHYMARAGYDPRAAVTLQEKFVALAQGGRQDWKSGLFSSHPPSEERVLLNLATARDLEAQGIAGGKLAAEQYRLGIAELLGAGEAYETYDRGREALRDNRSDAAFGFGRRAAGMEAREALFHGLMGDARYQEKRFREAVRHYSDAVSLDDGFFHYYLKRGLALERMQRIADARADLERSAELLPTPLAYAQLGRIARAEGRREAAKAYFQRASQSDTAVGREAAVEYLRMDVADHPTRYITAEGRVDARGYVLVQISNGSGIAVRDVVVRLRVTSPGRSSRIVERRLARSLGARTRTTLTTGFGPVPADSVIEVVVISARA